MPSYKVVGMSDAVEGKAAEYEDWYSNHHLPDVVQIPGFVSAQLFRLKLAIDGEMPTRYLTIYDVETDDLDGLLAELSSQDETGEMGGSDAVDMDSRRAGFFEAVGERAYASGPGRAAP